jgi:hypothetical protein
MRYTGLLFFIFISYTLTAGESKIDTGFVPSIRYSKKELKRELHDVKIFNNQIKDWNKAIKQKNADYLNVVFAKTMEMADKEHSELSNRISIRSKELYPPANPAPAVAPGFEDKPQVYNPELKHQIKHVNKEELLRKKAESDYLNLYVQIIKNEKTIMSKLKNVGTFNGNTPDSVFHEISKDFKSFVKEMEAEISLMKKETGKK